MRHRVLRDAGREVLAAAGLDVVSTPRTPQDTVDVVERLRPDLLMLDLDLVEPRDAIAVCRRLSSVDETSVLVIVDDHGDDDLLQVLEVGALGLVSHQGGTAELVRSAQAAMRGEACVPRRLLGGLLRGLVQRRRDDNEVRERYDRLSAREREVLSLLGEGLGHQEIAVELFISPQTARTHIQKVMTKLEVHSRVEAAALAVEHGLVNSRDGGFA